MDLFGAGVFWSDGAAAPPPPLGVGLVKRWPFLYLQGTRYVMY